MAAYTCECGWRIFGRMVGKKKKKKKKKKKRRGLELYKKEENDEEEYTWRLTNA